MAPQYHICAAYNTRPLTAAECILLRVISKCEKLLQKSILLARLQRKTKRFGAVYVKKL
jgi:hypothetical protein